MLDLGFLTNQKKLLVLALPRDNESVLVNYSDGVNVYCTLPAKKRDITVSAEFGNESLTINCPNLLFSSHYADLPKFNSQIAVNHSIFVYDKNTKDRIQACSYFISNVYRGGGICFGGFEPPFSPREAFNLFWTTPFNSELRGEETSELDDEDFYDYDLCEYIAAYHEEGIDYQPWYDMTEDICSDRFWASPNGADALLITGNKCILKHIPHKYWRKYQDAYPFVITLAFEKEDHWEFVSNSFKFCLDKGFVTTLPRFSETLSETKRKFTTVNVGATNEN